MIPMLYRYVGGAVIFLMLLGGAYLKGRSAVNKLWDADKAIAQAAYDAKVADNARLADLLADLNQDVENDLKPRLAASDARNSSLADSLRRHTRSCSLSGAPRAAGEPPEAAGESGDSGEPTAVDRALEAHLEACGRDAERLGTFQEWYKSLRDAQ